MGGDKPRRSPQDLLSSKKRQRSEDSSIGSCDEKEMPRFGQRELEALRQALLEEALPLVKNQSWKWRSVDLWQKVTLKYNRIALHNELSVVFKHWVHLVNEAKLQNHCTCISSHREICKCIIPPLFPDVHGHGEPSSRKLREYRSKVANALVDLRKNHNKYLDINRFLDAGDAWSLKLDDAGGCMIAQLFLSCDVATRVELTDDLIAKHRQAIQNRRNR